MFRNNLVVRLGPSSQLSDPELVVPFACRFLPGLPGMEAAAQGGGWATLDDDDHLYMAIGGDEEEEEEAEVDEMYVMTLTILHDDGRSSSVLAKRGDFGVTSPGDEVRATMRFDTRANLSLALEQCWLTRFEDGDSYDPESGDRLLISQGCPVLGDGGATGVSFSAWDRTRMEPAFSFRMAPLPLPSSRIYLVCLAGLCSPAQGSSGLNVGRVGFWQNMLDTLCALLIFFSLSVSTRSSTAHPRPTGCITHRWPSS